MLKSILKNNQNLGVARALLYIILLYIILLYIILLYIIYYIIIYYILYYYILYSLFYSLRRVTRKPTHFDGCVSRLHAVADVRRDYRLHTVTGA